MRTTCAKCGETFRPRGPQLRCNECRTLKCAACAAAFVSPNARQDQRFCSRACKDRSLSGSEPAWLAANRGRKPRSYFGTRRDKHGRAEDREWRSAVFARDDFTCQICGVKGGRLQADHIQPFSTHPEMRHVLANGRTLCVGCHKGTPTFGWKAYWLKVRGEIAAQRLDQALLPFEANP